ncbi:MAG: O-antigen ligase domain-containing protein [Comamonadaceae bacterium]|nr:MAG: O-antigen ligase domain-containing protein [Comamonadaceae bacterium]
MPGRHASKVATLLLGAGMVLGALGASVAIASSSMSLLLAALGAMGGAAFALITRDLHRPMLAAVFFLAPIDVSKAVIAPLVSRYYPAGPFYSPGLYLSLAHMALVALLVLWLGRRALFDRRWPPMTGLDWLAFGYMAFIWIRSIGADQGVLSLGSAASYSLAVLGFYAASHAIRDTSDLRLVLQTSVAVLLLSLVFVLLQSATQRPLQLPGSKALAFGATVDFGGGVATYRPSGFMNHPNSLAHYVVVTFPPALALALLGPRRLPLRVWWFSVLLAGAAALMLLVTLSRGGWASAALAATVVVAVYARKGLITPRQLGIAAVAMVLGAFVLVIVYPTVLLRLTAPDNRSLESRVLLADMAFTIIQANPLAGIGFGDYNRASFAYTAPLYATVSADYQLALDQLVVHNHFLLVAAELGVPAMLFFIYLLWRFARLPFPLSRWRDPATFAIAIGLAAAVIGETLFFNSDNYYADIRIFMFWLAAGLLQSIVLQTDRERNA